MARLAHRGSWNNSAYRRSLHGHCLSKKQWLSRLLDNSDFDLLGARYGNPRQFAPRFLETFTWRANQDDDALLAAIEVIRATDLDLSLQVWSRTFPSFGGYQIGSYG